MSFVCIVWTPVIPSMTSVKKLLYCQILFLFLSFGRNNNKQFNCEYSDVLLIFAWNSAIGSPCNIFDVKIIWFLDLLLLFDPNILVLLLYTGHWKFFFFIFITGIRNNAILKALRTFSLKRKDFSTLFLPAPFLSCLLFFV